MDVSYSPLELGLAGSVVFKVGTDALSVEGVLARVDEEFTVVENSTEANVTVLVRVDGDVAILLVTSLSSEKLSVLRMLLDLGSQLFDLFFIVIQTVAEMLLHITDFSFLWEQIKQIFDFQDVVLSDNCESFLNLHFLLPSCI